jgi:transcriptional regulator with XRE-family HTH domain
MTQTEMAYRLGVSLATVSRICSGDRRPSMELMDRIEEVLDWPFNDQANEIRCDAYHSAFQRKMEAKPA